MNIPQLILQPYKEPMMDNRQETTKLSAKKTLNCTATPLCSIAAIELGRIV
jgi:hypothetical protein